jgi:type I restriction enzyme, S subunit
MHSVKLKYIARLAYGDSLPKDESAGNHKAFGSNGPYALTDITNTNAPAIIIGRKGSYGKINWSKEKCFASDTTFFIDETCSNQHLRWLYYALQTLKLDQGSGEAAVPGLSREDAYERRIPFPERKTQIKIAEFLDHELRAIEKLIEAKSNLLAILTEKEQTLVTKAITQGTSSGVKLKRTGIDWLGQIHESWKLTRIKYVTSKIGSGVTPKGGAEIYLREGVPLLRSQNIYSNELRLDDVAYISEEIHESMSNSKVQKGDVLLNITGASLGRCYYFNGEYEEANVNQHVCILRPNDKVLTKYLHYIIISSVGQNQIAINEVGGGREGLNFEDIKAFVIPLPPKDEQTEIVDYLEAEIKKIKDLKGATEKSIALLRERRESLISEAVTGQLKVEVK